MHVPFEQSFEHGEGIEVSVRIAMGPLLEELRGMDCASLGERLGLDAKELHDRLIGVVEFNVVELVGTARWLGRQPSVVMAAFDSLFNPLKQGTDRGVEGLGDLP